MSSESGRAEPTASETVGDLVERLGEREAYLHIVAYNIQLRAAMADLIGFITSSDCYKHVPDAMLMTAKAALHG